MRRVLSHPLFAVLALYAMLVQSTWTGAMGVMASAGVEQARFFCATLAPVDQSFSRSAERLQTALFGPNGGHGDQEPTPDCPACQLSSAPLLTVFVALPREPRPHLEPFKRFIPQGFDVASPATGPPLGARAPPISASVSFA